MMTAPHSREDARALLVLRVAPEWVDYNGHLNDAEYGRIFSLAADALLEAIGLDGDGRRHHNYTFYTTEAHVCYRRAAYEGQWLSVGATVLDRDARRLQVFFAMRNAENALLATSEQLLMGIDSVSGRPAPFPPAVEAAINTLPTLAADAWPALAGRRIGLRSRRY